MSSDKNPAYNPVIRQIISNNYGSYFQYYYMFLILLFAIIILPPLYGGNALANKQGEGNNSTSVNKGNKRINSLSNNSISDSDIVLGNRNAKVLVIEYFAPTCTHCRPYHLKVFPELKSKYIDTGKIAYVMRECAGNKMDLDASLLARCKEDRSSYLGLMHQILSDQDHWAFSRNYRQDLTKIAKEHGVSEPEYQACLVNESMTEIPINHTRLVYSDASFSGTPSFYVNGQLFQGAFSFEGLSQIIDSNLSKGNQDGE